MSKFILIEDGGIKRLCASVTINMDQLSGPSANFADLVMTEAKRNLIEKLTEELKDYITFETWNSERSDEVILKAKLDIYNGIKIPLDSNDIVSRFAEGRIGFDRRMNKSPYWDKEEK